jgi:hypothetical protein
MSKPFLRFEDGKISLGGKDLMVRSANLSIAPSLNAERVYGEFDVNIVGAKTQFINYNPVDNLKGQLDINFFISADTFAIDGVTNTIDRMFDIKDGMNENPINGNIVGRYAFDNMYLNSFGFSMQPFGVIEANAKYNIYGTIRKTIDRRFTKSSVDFAHSMKSFGSMKASGTDADAAAGRQFEITSLQYNIMVGRKVHNRIRSSEHTSINTNANGVVPSRVSAENIESEMSIDCNEMIPWLNAYGDQQTYGSPEGIADSEIQAFLYDLQGNKIAKFKTQGKIQQQSYAISEGQQAKTSITIKEIIK